jgi:hypothetical protein
MQTAIDSYQKYLNPIGYVNADNKNLHIMRKTTMERYLRQNRAALQKFARTASLDLIREGSGILQEALA